MLFWKWFVGYLIKLCWKISIDFAQYFGMVLQYFKERITSIQIDVKYLSILSVGWCKPSWHVWYIRNLSCHMSVPSISSVILHLLRQFKVCQKLWFCWENLLHYTEKRFVLSNMDVFQICHFCLANSSLNPKAKPKTFSKST